MSTLLINLCIGTGLITLSFLLFIILCLTVTVIKTPDVTSFSFLGFGLAVILPTKHGIKVRKLWCLSEKRNYFIMLPPYMASKLSGTIPQKVFSYE